jgi:hypothetical protein
MNGLRKIIIYHNNWNCNTGLVHLHYEAPPALFHDIGSGNTKEERQMVIPFSGGNLYVSIANWTPKSFRFECSNCGKAHPYVNCNSDKDGSIREQLPPTPAEEVEVIYQTQKKLWAFGDKDPIPPLDSKLKEKVTKILKNNEGLNTTTTARVTTSSLVMSSNSSTPPSNWPVRRSANDNERRNDKKLELSMKLKLPQKRRNPQKRRVLPNLP